MGKYNELQQLVFSNCLSTSTEARQLDELIELEVKHKQALQVLRGKVELLHITHTHTDFGGYKTRSVSLDDVLALIDEWSKE